MAMENALSALHGLNDYVVERRRNALMEAQPPMPQGGYMPGAQGALWPFEGGAVENPPALWLGQDSPVEFGPYETRDNPLGYGAEAGPGMPRLGSVEDAEQYAHQRSRVGGLQVGPMFGQR